MYTLSECIRLKKYQSYKLYWSSTPRIRRLCRPKIWTCAHINANGYMDKRMMAQIIPAHVHTRNNAHAHQRTHTNSVYQYFWHSFNTNVLCRRPYISIVTTDIAGRMISQNNTKEFGSRCQKTTTGLRRPIVYPLDADGRRVRLN